MSEGPFNINTFGAPQGWQCPICKRVYSPFTPMCYHCSNSSFKLDVTCTEKPLTEASNQILNDLTAFAKVEQTLNGTVQKYREKINASREAESK